MSYRKDVENLLGKECMTKLLNHVRRGKMDDDQMKDFVLQLGELLREFVRIPTLFSGTIQDE